MSIATTTTFTLVNNPTGSMWFLFISIIILLSWWCYGRSDGNPVHRILLGTLRFLSLLSILLLLCGPTTERSEKKIQKDQVLVLVDRTGSMTVEDVKRGDSRISREEQSNEVINAPHVWESISGEKTVSWFGFDNTPESTADPENLQTAMGRRTDVASSILQLEPYLDEMPTSAIIIISDGRSTDPPQPGFQQKLKGLGVPVISIPLGSSEAMGDIAITRIVKPNQAYNTDNIPVTVHIEFHGSLDQGREYTLSLEDADTGLVLDSKPFTNTMNTRKMELTLVGKPRGAGAASWRVVLNMEEPDLIEKNNQQSLTIQLTDQPLRALYVEGRPRWEYRYLKNLLIRERTIESSTMLLSADSDFSQEGDRPISRIPTTRDEFEQWDVLIIGDVSSTSFSDEQSIIIKELVSEGKLDLVWIGGERWTPNSWSENELSDLIPFTTPYELQSIRNRIHINPTQKSERMGILQIEDVDGSFDTTSNTELSWSGFNWTQHVRRDQLKSGSEILAESIELDPTDDDHIPILLAMRYGLGRIIYSTTDEYWRWRHGRGERLYEQFWIQILRSIARTGTNTEDDRPRITTSHRNPMVDTPVSIEIIDTNGRYIDPSVQYMNIDIRDSNGDVFKSIELGRNGAAGSRYSTTWTPTRAGLVTLTTTRSETTPGSSISMNVMDSSDEYKQPEADHESLEDLSTMTSGFIIDPDEISSLPGLLPDRSTITIEYHQSNLWNSPWLFVIPMLLLTIEWVFRRLLQLA